MTTRGGRCDRGKEAAERESGLSGGQACYVIDGWEGESGVGLGSDGARLPADSTGGISGDECALH